MSKRSLKKEWEVQDEIIAGLPEDYQYPLFSAKRAIESQRRSAYRSTASAAQEIVDNALEAGADKIHVVMDRTTTSSGGRGKSVSTVAFIDDGAGMRSEMIRFALSWGGGTRAENPDFIGKFGFGLPNASINQTRLVRVFSRRSAEEPWMMGTLDIDAVDTTGKVNVQPPIEGELPDFVVAYAKRNKIDLEHGTVVLWVNPDRLTYRKASTLKEHLVDQFSVVYRYQLDEIEMVVEGVKVVPTDPLFVLPGARFYRAEDGAEVRWTRAIPVMLRSDPDSGENHLVKLDEDNVPEVNDPLVSAMGTITVRAVSFPLGFAVGRKTEGITPVDDFTRDRFNIRKTRRGISFVRAGREIETVDAFPRSARDTASGLGSWPLLQSYAYHWGVEVSFLPELDEAFGITNDKQGVRPIEDFWRLLAKEELDKQLTWLNSEQEKLRKQAKKDAKKPKATEKPSDAERAVAAADTARGDNPEVPDLRKDEEDKKKDEAARKRSAATNESVNDAKKAIEDEARRRPYLIDYEEVKNGPFYRPEWRDGVQLVVWINRVHPFYEVLYQEVVGLPDAGHAKSALDAMLIVLARAELTTNNEQTRLFYEAQREDVWSPDLKRVMQALAAFRADASDEEEEEQEEPVEAAPAA